MGIWGVIAAEAALESPLWEDAQVPSDERQLVAVFSALADERYALGLETIYEGYLVHYGRPRLFRPQDEQSALLLGDYLYAHGLVRIAELGDVEAIRELAELISHCAFLRAEGRDGDGEAWADTASWLGGDEDDAARARALTAHARLVG